jgi:phage gp36-like protein
VTIYAALDDLIERFGERELIELTDDAGVGTIDQARVDSAIASAEAMINGHLASRHQLPLSTVPGFLKDIACDLARHRLHRTSPPELVEKNRAAAMLTLSKIAEGKVRLDQGVETEAARPGAILSGGTERIFGRDSMKGY